MTRAAAYPKYVLREANAWLRGHPWQADGLLAAALLAFSAPQLAAGRADGLIRAAFVAVNVLMAAVGSPYLTGVLG